MAEHAVGTTFKCAKVFLKTLVLDHHVVAPITSLTYSEYHDHVFGSSALSPCPFANMIPKKHSNLLN